MQQRLVRRIESSERHYRMLNALRLGGLGAEPSPWDELRLFPAVRWLEAGGTEDSLLRHLRYVSTLVVT